MVECIDLAFCEEVGEGVSADRLAFGRVEGNHLAVSHVVPVVEGDEDATVCYEEFDGCNGIEKCGSRGQPVGAVFFEAIEFRCGVRALAGATKSVCIAKTFAGNYTDEIGARVTEYLVDLGRRPLVGLSGGNSNEDEDWQ